MWTAPWLLASWALAATVAHAGHPPSSEPGARRDVAELVYERILAPCCWLQTLDVHESDVAALLRDEIAQRLEQGETPVTIEDDLAARFGERVRAVPRDHDSREALGMSVMTSLAVGLVMVFLWARRWVRSDDALSAAIHRSGPVPDSDLCDYDEPLQRALRDLEEPS